MCRKLQRIEVANLDFIRFFSSCRPCRPQRHPTPIRSWRCHIVQRPLRQILPSGGRRRNHHQLFLLQRSGAITRHRLALFSGALLAVSCDYRSSRQRTRSSTAHQFCTTASVRRLNGEPCGLVQTDAFEAAWTDEGARRPFHPHSYFLAVGGNTPIKRRYIAASA